MKIALFQPYVPDLNTIPPLGLLYLASILEQGGFEVKLFDERLDFSNTLRKVQEYNPDILGISAVTAAYLRGLEVSSILKKAIPKLKVVFGGPHSCASTLSVLQVDIVDYVITGEGERAFLLLCKAIELEENYRKKYE